MKISTFFVSFLISLFFNLCSAQELDISILQYNPGRNNSFVTLKKNDELIFNLPLASQYKANHDLLGVEYVNNTFIIGQLKDDYQSIQISKISQTGEMIKKFDIKWPEKELPSNRLIDHYGYLTVDSNENIYVKHIGKDPNKQYGVQYLRKYSKDGKLEWERKADEKSGLGWVEYLTKLPNGVLADYDANSAFKFEDSKEPTSKYIFSTAKEIVGVDRIIRVNSFQFKYQHSRLTVGTNSMLYYVNVFKEDKQKYSFYVTDFGSGHEVKLQSEDLKPNNMYYSVIDELGNIIISYQTSEKININGSKKKTKVYNNNLVTFDKKGMLINKTIISEKTEDKSNILRPIYAINGKLVSLSNESTLDLSDYSYGNKYSTYKIGQLDRSSNILQSGMQVYPFQQNLNEFVVRLSSHVYALIKVIEE